ncbi:2-acylglycerol O-acyltransferase 2 [Trichinella zimbabwensis]|uniref:diacylglycerol O-acyltransferase n=1 Tax=Trichinella zimbabwensis TaxID=268475 RepID=A0A0V1HYY1_9BILA|nr:2-acylglycerol O-acyltransferase 2 [Trichinella zimbabwensis]
MTRVLGIEFAPLCLPWERRLQTLSVLHYVVIFLGPYTLIALGIYLLVCTQYWWLVLLYSLWLYVDQEAPKRGSRPKEWFRRWRMWDHLRDYFPIELIKTADLPPDRNYLFGYHPHGIMSFGAFCNFCTEATNFSQLFPGVVDVSKQSLAWLLGRKEKGYAAVVVVGGATEALNAHPRTNILVLKSRKGFIRQAIVSGASLVPVFSFGENDLYFQWPNPEGSWVRQWQRISKKILGWSTPLICGRGLFNYTFGLLPYRRPIHTVVGSPIHVEQCCKPSQEQIDNLHKLDSEEDAVNERRVKIVVVGDCRVGKTSLCFRFVQEQFISAYHQTLGLDFYTKYVTLGDRFRITLQIWDVSGQQMDSAMLDKYVFGADGAMLVYDVTNAASFDKIKDWYRLVQRAVGDDEQRKVRFMVVGNKTDLEHQRNVKYEKQQELVKRYHMLSCQTSAKLGDSVTLCFLKLAAEIVGVQLSRTELDSNTSVIKAEVPTIDRPNDSSSSEIMHEAIVHIVLLSVVFVCSTLEETIIDRPKRQCFPNVQQIATTTAAVTDSHTPCVDCSQSPPPGTDNCGKQLTTDSNTPQQVDCSCNQKLIACPENCIPKQCCNFQTTTLPPPDPYASCYACIKRNDDCEKDCETKPECAKCSEHDANYILCLQICHISGTDMPTPCDKNIWGSLCINEEFLNFSQNDKALFLRHLIKEAQESDVILQ